MLSLRVGPSTNHLRLIYCGYMEREVRERFERIEALLRAGVERGNQMETRFNGRVEIFDRRLEAMRKLVEAGMKFVMRMGQRQRALEDTVRDLAKSQKAFLDSLRRGGNGSRHIG
jgi:hypothetical protein